MAALGIFSLHLFTFVTFIILTTLPTSNGSDNPYKNCSTLISCGKLQNVGYPFWGLGRPQYCGHPILQLHCLSNQSNEFPFLKLIGDQIYYVLGISETSLKMTIQVQEVSKTNNNSCPFHSFNKYLEEVLPFSASVVAMTLFYNCPKIYMPNGSQDSITCRDDKQRNITAYYLRNADDKQFKFCKFMTIHVLAEELNHLNQGNEGVMELLEQGYEVDYLYSSACYTCQDSGGICGSSTDEDFACFRENHKSGKWKLILGLAIPGVFFMLVALNVGFCCCMKPKFHIPTLLSTSLSSDPMNSDIEIGSSFCGIPVFSYIELQEATNNFNVNQELGHGGFGIVYYGKLRDGREVAVKRLYEKNYKQIGQFMNEIDIFTSLHHHNLVKLYGCTSRHSRELLLVYEFISNGTVADHLHGDRIGSEALSWAVRMKIATETAGALSYLHASDIIHRDVKTNNILLDKNFSVKVADFGLSRLFPSDATHVSTAPQGTPGYLDPGYNKCYQVTKKSDVYSFGVVLIELISSQPAVDISRKEDEINLSDYAMNRIQNGTLNELVDQKIGFGSDFKVKRMIILVAELAFQCLQREKELRPSMDEVLKVLKKIESTDYESLEAEVLDQSRKTSTQTSTTVGNNIKPPSRDTQHLPSPISVIGGWTSTSSTSNTSA